MQCLLAECWAISCFLQKWGCDVLLVGFYRNGKTPYSTSYKVHRINPIFNKGPFFYAELNIRLFFYVLFHKADFVVANDLDTLLANYLASRLKKIPVVYDSHELYTEVPELSNRKFIKSIWETIEGYIFPKLKYAYTVNDTIAGIFKNKYKVDVKTIRNVSKKNTIAKFDSKTELGLPTDKKIILLQGAFINIERGGEEAVLAMQYVEGAVLVIIGGGDVFKKLTKMVIDLDLSSKVKFIDKVPYQHLMHYTANADIGLSLDKDTNLNYRYSLPNKLFDYIQAGVPVLVSNLVEPKKIISEFNIGEVIENHDPKHIAEKMMLMLTDKNKIEMWKANLKKAAELYCWENEEKKLWEVYRGVIED